LINFSRLTLAVALVASSAMAQTRMGGFTHAGRIGRFQQSRIVIAREHHRLNPSYGYYAAPYFNSDYDEPFGFKYPPEPSAPPVQVQVKTEPLPDPVLLELRGGRWVKVTNFGEESDRALARATAADTQTKAKTLPPAVLVYRDVILKN
jgi:hypothetical protein